MKTLEVLVWSFYSVVAINMAINWTPYSWSNAVFVAAGLWGAYKAGEVGSK